MLKIIKRNKNKIYWDIGIIKKNSLLQLQQNILLVDEIEDILTNIKLKNCIFK